MNKKIVIVAPHPDDEVIGVGGTLCQLAKDTHVVVTLVTDGRRSPSGKYFDYEMAKLGYFESKDVAEKLGCSWNYLGFEKINPENIEKISSGLENILFIEQPDEIYVPHFFDAHKTHNIVTDLTIKALRVMCKKTEIWGYEVWAPIQSRRSSDELKLVEINPEAKRELMNLYKSRFEETDFESILGLNRFRSAFRNDKQLNTGKKNSYCEMFIRLNPEYIDNPLWKEKVSSKN
ncbi:MAG: PIG-L family deacetylase [Candidatus Nanoarchaeia archaeon]|nr:PIG-L family deacetylase [Candidatus Nanoarchaeia archaeon]